ncbi:peptidase M23 [Kingella negevensis]|uniref:Roadblock/LC7 domain protein n=1 Tax=Kingella negevensis TaxID=1522312 RepID=A0A238HJ89_9NEIS|nr:peptidase M23 [Kingella negevensis]MDK4679654.1 peptidase M23 [Kingella negevensis]MDK4682627.1 peptidase M23 [Kingella negevensis]MDK4684170.1 peptidase M23 [Kingella negevensis]MDK4690824.1 peptidase M23 [Kingella negevensis]MDK4694029.1 peptidase M23 [Kingella negevensis]
MESTLSLQTNLYPHITPAGAFYAVANKSASASRTLLANILQANSNEAITQEKLLQWSETDDVDSALNLLYRLQRLEFLYGGESPAEVPALQDDTLQNLLPHMSDSQKALLIDQDGFYFANSGFHHEAAEEVAILASEAIRLSERHALLIKNNLNIYQNAWGLCDPTGQSELTFFPIYIKDAKYILVTGGTPQLHKEAFVQLVRALYQTADAAANLGNAL